MLAAWMALERRSFSLVDRLDFIVTVNKGIEPPDCWISAPLHFHDCPSRLLIIYEQFADPLQISKSALPLFRSSKGKYLFFDRLSVNTVLSRIDWRQTLPPCSSATRRARVSPRPVPLGFPAVTNGSNNVLPTEAGMPGTLSRIVR